MGAVFAIFITFGSSIFMFYLYFKNKSIRKRCAEEIQAVCTRLNRRRKTDSDGRTSISCNPEFEAEVNGEIITFQGDTWTTVKPFFTEGDMVTICINPEINGEYYVPGYSEKGEFLYLVAGVVVMGLGIIIIIAIVQELLRVFI